MKKIVLYLLALGMAFYVQANDIDRANIAAEKAFDKLDCEFEDCKKEESKPKVTPIIIIKEKVIEKPVIQEKIVYKEKPQQEKIAQPSMQLEQLQQPQQPQSRQQQPQVQPQQQRQQPQSKQPQPKALGKIIYNKAFFDIHPRSQAPILDYIDYSPNSSFDINQFVDSVKKIKESRIKAYIYGKLEVPDSITTKEVYVYSGENYRTDLYWWKKLVYYNDSETAQSADYFLVDVQQDRSGRRFVKYKIYFLLDHPWEITPANTKILPSGFFFKMAPKKRGFKDKFVKVSPYIVEEE